MIRLLVALVFALGTNVPLHAEELFVSAAASLTDALKEIGAKFEKESNIKIVFNFGASSMLARQIEDLALPAPGDLRQCWQWHVRSFHRMHSLCLGRPLQR